MRGIELSIVSPEFEFSIVSPEFASPEFAEFVRPHQKLPLTPRQMLQNLRAGVLSYQPFSKR